MSNFPQFKLWSESNPKAKEILCPNIEMQNWEQLTQDDKTKILRHFNNSGWLLSSFKIYLAISIMNNKYKKQSFGRGLLDHFGHPHWGEYSRELESCCKQAAWGDFNNIFFSSKEQVVFEILSIYAIGQINYSKLKEIETNTPEEERIRLITEAFERLDSFASVLNNIFEQFGLNAILTREGFIPRQDKKITEEIWKPVLNFLTAPQWSAVNRELKDAFEEFQKRSQGGYSSCITHAVSGLQAFLQILVCGQTGKGDLGDLIAQALNKNLIPNDLFSKKIFKDIESILMSERQTKGHAHPKEEYATEKHARLVLNLTMIFLQHSIQKI